MRVLPCPAVLLLGPPLTHTKVAARARIPRQLLKVPGKPWTVILLRVRALLFPKAPCPRPRAAMICQIGQKQRGRRCHTAELARISVPEFWP